MRMMKKALTTAELMIALTIVGVIAALVLPVLIHDYNAKVYVTKLKRTYNLLANALEQACIDNSVSNFGMTRYARSGGEADFIEKYLPVTGQGNLFADSYERIRGDYNASSFNRVQNTTYDPYVLRGGMVVYMLCNPNNVVFSPNSYKLCYFIVDINGKMKPNMAGRDIFTLMVDQSTNQITDMYKTLTYCTENTRTQTILGTTLNLNGAGCLYQIMENNWEMKY